MGRARRQRETTRRNQRADTTNIRPYRATTRSPSSLSVSIAIENVTNPAEANAVEAPIEAR